ncbi:MAG: hypothetical protein OEV00_15085, partial [Acidobacteriota bacterium]|nr:hypothetical protein [Acidobacteriota bacterium]
GMPPNAPESGDTLASTNFNDTSGGQLLDAEYRDGSLWSTRAVMCNVGGGDAESCVDWLQIDVSGPAPVLLDQQAGGGFGSADEFRYYPDLAVDRNGNMAIAYTKSGFSSFTEIWATGREAGDPAGTLQSEVLQVAGSGNYTDGVGCAGTCDRWGDYTGMATDPDGCRFWYIGEYSDGGAAAWKTHIGSYKFDSCSIDSAIQSGKGTYACRDTMEVVVRDGIPIDAATAAAQTIITSSTDSETIPAESWIGSECTVGMCVTWTASLALDTLPGSVGDGTLQVANAETVTIDYTDPHGGHADQSREVTTTCQTGFEGGGYVILGGCEGGEGGEAYRDYIDAGEYVQYVYGVFNPHSAPDYTDVEATLTISGPLSGHITIGNPTVNLGALAPGQLAGAVFDIYVDPAAVSFGLSQNDFILTLSSVADGFDVPQVLTQTQALQAEDNVVAESICFNGESDEGFQSSTYVESYICTSPPCGAGGVTVNSVAAPWARGEGCGSETRDDYPEMTCDVNGTFAYTLNDSSVSCGQFAQDFTSFTSDVLYSPIMTPANTGNAPNGHPWFYSWQFAEWFFRADVSFTGDPTQPGIAATHLWTDDYLGTSTPSTNDINGFPYWQGNFWSPPNQDWDSATPWDPQNVPANWFGHGLLGVIGEATPGRQWRWAIWQRDWDAFLQRAPIVAEATAGMSYDDLNFVYEQFHAEAQTTVCGTGDVAGRVSFDRLSYTECGGGDLEVSVLDGNAAGPVTVTVSSLGTGDTETLSLTGAGPRWVTQLTYSLDGGASPDDGVLFVTPNDSIEAVYADDVPVDTVSAVATLLCSEESLVVTGVAAIDDSGNSGDSDGIPDTNELVDFTLTIRNDGDLSLSNVVATIWTDDPDVDCVTKSSASFGT